MDLSLEEKDSLSKSFPQKSQGESGPQNNRTHDGSMGLLLVFSALHLP